MSCETEFLLVQWGVWQSGGHNLGMASAGALMMRAVGTIKAEQEDARPSVVIADATALMVDRAVARLKLRDKGMYAVLQLRYVRRMGVAMIAREINENRHVTGMRLAGAVAWVDGCINSFSDN